MSVRLPLSILMGYSAVYVTTLKPLPLRYYTKETPLGISALIFLLFLRCLFSTGDDLASNAHKKRTC